MTVAPPVSRWAKALRAAGYPQLASTIDQAVEAAKTKAGQLAEKLRCMEPVYDEKMQAYCQVLLSEELKAEKKD